VSICIFLCNPRLRFAKLFLTMNSFPMSSLRCTIVLASLCSLLLVPIGQAAEPGYIALFEGANVGVWKQSGPGEIRFGSGIAEISGNSADHGTAWYSGREFSDFELTVDCRSSAKEFNSGVLLRLPALGAGPQKATAEGYEVCIHEAKDPDGWPTGSIRFGSRPGVQMPFQKDWNRFEIKVVGQRYTVKINGQIVNEFTGKRRLSGYVGLDQCRLGPVEFRNLLIKDLSAAAPAALAPLTTIQSDPNQPRIEVVKDQGPNATEWALTPLEEAIPSDIRQNLTYLREDLLDEAKKSPKAATDAYALASDYCDKILSALEQRDLARVNAGYSAAQADANVRVTSQALESRRNYKMSWPQYAREQSQRAEIYRQQSAGADVRKEQIKVNWANRSVQMRAYLDDLYTKLRAALR